MPCALAGRALGAQAAADDGAAHAEHTAHAPTPPRAWARVAAQAVGQATRTTPAFGGEPRTEGYLTQPVLMAHGRLYGPRVRFTGTLNLEGLTLRAGQINPGIYGEGWVDRRHPHTFVHEAIVAVDVVARPRVQASIAAGKGFVAFGSDDPMMRPFAQYPVNHHLAQILERYVATGAVRVPLAAGAAALVEASVFGADEPTGPWAWPRARRFGDAWAVRATARAPIGRASTGAGEHDAHAMHDAVGAAPARGAVELSASRAQLPSPENPLGGGLDQAKTSVVGRWTRGAPLGPAGLGVRASGSHALVEWARTDEQRRGRRAFRYQSVLAEAAARRRGIEVAARWERTGRLEEERLVDPFRSVRPHFEFNVLGLTEWRIATVGVATQLATAGRRPLRLSPFVELSRAVPRDVVRPSTFEPAAFYGARVLWTTSVGVRAGLGAPHGRMGRYGVASEEH